MDKITEDLLAACRRSLQYVVCSHYDAQLRNEPKNILDIAVNDYKMIASAIEAAEQAND